MATQILDKIQKALPFWCVNQHDSCRKEPSKQPCPKPEKWEAVTAFLQLSFSSHLGYQLHNNVSYIYFPTGLAPGRREGSGSREPLTSQFSGRFGSRFGSPAPGRCGVLCVVSRLCCVRCVVRVPLWVKSMNMFGPFEDYGFVLVSSKFEELHQHSVDGPSRISTCTLHFQSSLFIIWDGRKCQVVKLLTSIIFQITYKTGK